MSAKSTPVSSKTVRSSFGERAVWGAVGLALVAALAITLVAQFGPARKVAQPVVAAQSVPDAAAQGVAGYLAAHRAADAQSVPDASSQGIADYIAAHRAADAQSVPDAATKGVNDYLRAHGVNIP